MVVIDPQHVACCQARLRGGKWEALCPWAMLPSNQGVAGRKGRRERALEETMELKRLEFCLLLLTGA